MTTTQQKTRYFEVLPHKAGSYDAEHGTGDYFTLKHVGKILPESKKGAVVGIFRAGRAAVRLATVGYPGIMDGPVFPLDVLREVGEFFKGESVWIRSGAKSVAGEMFTTPTAATVVLTERPDFPRRLVRVASGRRYSLKVEDLSHERPTVTVTLTSAADFTASIPFTASWPISEGATKAALRFEDIEAGDKVTFRLNPTKEEFTTTAYLEDSEVMFMGWSTVGLDGGVDPELTLLRVEKPEPPKYELPTAIGSVIQFEIGEVTRVSTLVSPGRWKILLENGEPYTFGGSNSAGMLGTRLYSDFVTLHDAGSDS